jgi:multiple sugar transport system substrate-binding protein
MSHRRAGLRALASVCAAVALSVVAATTATAGTARQSQGAWSQKYAGTTLHFIGEATLNTQIMQKLLPDFQKKTGIAVVVEQSPYDSLVQKAVLDFAAHKGNYDVLSIPYEYLGAYAEKKYIEPDVLSGASDDKTGYKASDIIPALWKASSDWKGKVYGAPSNSAVMMMFYRKDLFSNPGEQAAFKKRYGYALAPARTWKQYRDIAQFFTRASGQTLAGKKLSSSFYGLTIAGKRHVATVLEYFNYAWTMGGGFFSPKGQVALDSPGNVKGLQYEVGLTRFAPAAYTTTTWDEMTAAFQQGTIAEAIAWGDTAGGMEDPASSKVVGKVGYASIPVERTGQKPIAHLGSWTYAVNADSKNKEAGALFIKWALSKDVQTKLASAGGLPALSSVFKDPDLVAKLPYWRQEGRSLSQAKSRPRIPQWGAMADILQDDLSRALAKSTTPQKALADAQTRVEAALKGALPVTYQ